MKAKRTLLALSLLVVPLLAAGCGSNSDADVADSADSADSAMGATSAVATENSMPNSEYEPSTVITSFQDPSLLVAANSAELSEFQPLISFSDPAIAEGTIKGKWVSANPAIPLVIGEISKGEEIPSFAGEVLSGVENPTQALEFSIKTDCNLRQDWLALLADGRAVYIPGFSTLMGCEFHYDQAITDIETLLGKGQPVHLKLRSDAQAIALIGADQAMIFRR
ncbi:hypothetical protein [Corynebacterium caspium]|uniref:hypothetical protein n=1 Tax=Corynebacterium caspium TaxID=234828 RepID=UPI00036A9166|nr:hypothetical protein [Corynebacterium caspium]WKD59880.1 hypothetical protein CCASP_07525 [Corynebacterium caspium DSM 44850]